MNRFLATLPWRGAAIAGALLLAAGLAGPATAANTNLTATAKYSSSSDWESDLGNTTFVAAKAFDGDLSTRWNVASGDNDGSWIAAEWDAPVTINKVVVYERFTRIAAYSIQKKDAGKDWETVYEAHDEKFEASVKSRAGGDLTFQVRFAQPFQTQGLRILFDSTTSAPSIAEVEAYNNPSGSLTGTVTDPSGKGIEGVTVSGGGESATTDAAGKYTLTADAGTYNIVASKTGFFRDRIARGTELPANGSATHDFVLLPLPPNVALSATAAASSELDDTTLAANANDGKVATRWTAADDTAGATLDLTWSQAQSFNKIVIREAGDTIRNYSLQRYDKANDAYVDIAGAANVNVASGRAANPILTHLLPEAVNSERLRLLINVNEGSPSIFEVEVANAPVATTKVLVKDAATGNPVPNATITSDLGAVLGTTNDKGELSLLVEPDDYVLSASAAGYFTGTPVAFTINAGETQDVALTAPATGPNLARTAKPSASTEEVGGEAALVNDGDEETTWIATVYNDQWVGVTFDKPTHLTVVQLRNFLGVIQRSYLEVLDADGKTWKEVPGTTFSPQFLAGKPADFFLPDGITTMGVRYYITATHSVDNIPGLGEMIIYDSPIPKP